MIMKIVLLFALYLSSASAATCQIYACATNVGAACGTNSATSPSTYTQCTGSNQFCNTTSSTTQNCALRLANGQACSSFAVCTSLYCQQGGVCAPGNRVNGATCTYAADCNSNVCTSSVCVGANINEACSNAQQCNVAPNLYCNLTTSLCVYRTGLNAVCSSSSAPCVSGTFCSANTNRCVPLYSSVAGVACNDDITANGATDSDSQCGDGLTCISGTCAAAAASSGSACTRDSDCTAVNEQCSCNYATGSGVCRNKYVNKLAGASATASATTSCFTSGACAAVGAQTQTCAAANCRSGYCNALKFQNAVSATNQVNQPACLRSALTLPSFCNGASSVAISAFVVFAAVAALIM